MSLGSDAQREVTRIALIGVKEAGFVLAGSGAIREHGIIERPTEDVDLFTADPDPAAFGRAVDRVVRDVRRAGYAVEVERRASGFARLRVSTLGGQQLVVDMGVDWRERDPVNLDVGPVLSVEDAIGNKMSALCSRAEPRDYLDVDAIRRAGVFNWSLRQRSEMLVSRSGCSRPNSMPYGVSRTGTWSRTGCRPMIWRR